MVYQAMLDAQKQFFLAASALDVFLSETPAFFQSLTLIFSTWDPVNPWQDKVACVKPPSRQIPYLVEATVRRVPGGEFRNLKLQRHSACLLWLWAGWSQCQILSWLLSNVFSPLVFSVHTLGWLDNYQMSPVLVSEDCNLCGSLRRFRD